MQTQTIRPRETLRARLTRFMNERNARAQAEAAQRKPLPTEEQLAIEDQRAIDAEIRAVEVRQADIARVLERAAKGSSASYASYENQELRSEYNLLHDLRQDIEHDRQHPITRDRDGKLIDARLRMIRRERAQSLRESLWRASEAARGEGDHRRARRLRLESLRARQLAEAEMWWRSVPHYW